MGNVGNDLVDIAGFALPTIEAGHPLHRILDAALSDRSLTQFPPHRSSTSHNVPAQNRHASDLRYWDASFFNLDQVRIFRDAPAVDQQAIVSLANQGLLQEAYFIEKAGMGYMAKMVLLAETLEEQMLYSLFTADETLHLSQIRSFFTPNGDVPTDPFLALLSEVIAHPDKALVLFVLQVVLEGWGLSHYRQLAQGCRHSPLAQVLHQFLQAEARHHATGVSLFDPARLSPATQSAVETVLQTFLQMIRVGPQRVVTAIAAVKGDLSRSQRIQVLTELDTETHSGTRLKLLRSLMQNAGADVIVDALAQHQLFEPLPAYQCVAEFDASH